MADSLMQQAADGVPRKRGKLTLLDVSGAAAHEYKRVGEFTLVPISRDFGGIEESANPFGKVVHRKLDDNLKVVEETIVGDGAMAQPAADPMAELDALELARAGAGAILPVVPPAGGQPVDPAVEGLVDRVVRLQMELAKEREKTKAPPERAPRRPVAFHGPWGRLLFSYDDVIITSGAVVLVGKAGEQRQYEPPAGDTPFEVQVDGGGRLAVLHPGLTFDHAGDTLTVLVVCSETDGIT